MREDEFCGVCGNGILYGYRTVCEDCIADGADPGPWTESVEEANLEEGS